MAEDITLDNLEEFPQTEEENTYEVEALISEGEPESIPNVVTVTSDISDTASEDTEQTDTINETVITPDDSIVDFGVVPEEPDNTENPAFPIKKRTTYYTEAIILSDYSVEGLENYISDSEWKVYAVFNDNTEREVTWDEVYDPASTSTLYNIVEAAQIAHANNQHYWNNDNGVHITDDTLDAWATEWAKTNHGTLSTPTAQKPWHNILMNSVGIILRTGTKFLSSWSKSGVAFYDGNGNSASNVIASYGSNGAQIGKSSEKHVIIDSSGLSVYDENGDIAPVFASNIAADHAKIGDLIADTADIDTIRANSAKVNDVTAQAITAATGYIAALTAGEIAASDLIADHASVGTLKTDTADIDTIRANSAKVNDVTAQAITAATGYIGTLTSKNITANDMAAAHANVGVLLTKTADIETIRANSAKVNNVTAQAITAATGYIAALTAGEIAASDLIADHASVGTLKTDTADIATIRANSAKVNDVTAQDITAATGYIAALTSKNITANDISADHISVDTLKTNTADIATIRANSAKVNDVTAQAITAATGYIAALTAGEIAASDLIADHASVGTLKTDTADIDTIRANSAKVNDVTAQAITAATGYIAALTAGEIAASDLIADHGEIASLETNYAHITNGVINNAKISHADVNGLNANYAHVTNGVIDNADINHADVVGLNANYAHITNGVIDSAKIDQANVNNLRTNYAHVTNGVIDESWINHASVVGLDINYAHIENGVINNAKIDQADVNDLDAYYAHITNGVIDNADINHADVVGLNANYAHITNGVIDNADINHADVVGLNANYAHVTNGVIDNAEIDYADVNDLDAHYAHVTNGVIDQANISHANVMGLSANYAHTVNGVIDNATIDQADVNDLDAYYAHITNGVIDNADIGYADVVGLNANYAHITNGVIDNADINHADVVGLNANYAHVTNGVIDNAEIDYADVNDLDAHYAHITNGVIDNADIGYADVVGLNANYAHITNGVIDNAEIDQADVNNLRANYAHITNGNIDNAKIDQAYVTGLETHYASIANGVINKATIDQANVNNLDSHYAHITNGVIDNADINHADVVGLNANYAHITSGVIDNAEIDYADVNDLEAHYAQIDMANVSNGWLTNGVIKNGAIKNGMIESVTASKLTAGTINADNVTITNLKAENIKVSKINGVNVTGKTVKDALEQHEDDISDLDSKIDDAIEDLNDRIDAQIETWTTDTIPLLSNYPASSWNTNDLKAEHVGDICYVINAVSDADGYTYRFAYDNTTSSYKWVLIKDNQVTAALGRISDLETFESNTSTWIDETDEGLTTIRENHTALSGKVDKTLISTTQLWFTKANTTAPNAPSAHVTVNNPATANAWNIAVPTYNASYPNYYYCYEWQYADNTYGWSAVTRDIATGEMQAMSRSAQNTANSAIKSSIQLWYIKADDTAPSKPTKTSDVVSNAATANKWNTLVPTYNNSYPYYFYCWQYQKADNTYIWSDVVYDRATTENQANSRNAQATLATKVDSSTFSELVETVDEHSNTITSLSTVSETLIKESIEYIVGTQTAVTGLWTGVTRETALYNGKTIAYRLPYAGSGNASLNLTLAGGGTTGAKAVYINNTRVTTHYPANSVITLTYNGTDWRASAYWDGNTYDRTRYSVYIKIVTAATRTWQMFVGNNDGYRRLVAGISYDLSYPLLVFSDTPAAGETKNTGYLCVSGYIYNIYVGTTVQSAAVNKLVYLKGTVNGTIFTVASSNFLTCAVPTTEDNFFYIPLGVITVVDSTNTTGYFQTNDQLWAYVDGKFQQANPMVKTTNTVVNEVKQTADTNTASIRGLTTITDNLSLFNNGHPGYWRIDRYKKTSRFTSTTIIPEYSDFSDVNFIETIYKTDEEFNVNWNIDNTYLAKIYTYVHTTEDVTIAGYRFAHDDSCVLYVNNEEIGKSGSTTPFAVEFTLTSGWNKIEALLYENTGGEYARFIEAETTTAVSILSFTGVDRIQADLPVFDSETTEHKISEIVQTIDGFQTTVSNTYATKNSFNALQDSFNNLEIGGRNLLKNTSLPMTKTVTIGDSGWQAVLFYEMVEPYINFFKLNDELTVSFDWETNNTTGGNWRLQCGQTNPYTWGTVVKAIGTRATTSNFVDISSNNYSGYIAITYKATQTHIDNGALLKYLKIRWDGADWNGKTFTISNAKVEKGNQVTDWTPAPEDIDETTNNIITNLDTEIKQRKALYAKCDTGAAAQDKTGTCANFTIYSGVKIAVKFTNGNSHVLPTLNINGTGAFNIKSYSGNSLNIDTKEYAWIGNSIHEFIYDGTNWRLIDSGITSRITQAETKIDQNTEAITLRATKTEAIQIAQPNLSPVVSYDTYPTAAIQDTRAATVGQYWKYWTAPCVGNVTRLSDGWMHYDYTNTNSSGVVRVEWAIEKSDDIKPGTLYTFLVEVRNVTYETTNATSSVAFYIVQSNNSQFWGGSTNKILEHTDDQTNTDTTINLALQNGKASVIRRYAKYSEADGSTHIDNGEFNNAYKLMMYNCNVGAGQHIIFDARISVYEGEYLGVYKPYVGNQLYSTQAELKVANDAISTKVETNGVISAINQSAEQITIDANRVNISGAAIFTSGALSKVVTATQNEWYSSTSTSSLTGGSWGTTQPSVAAGRFIWTREKITYSDGTSEYKPGTNGVCTQGQTNLSSYYTKTQADNAFDTKGSASSVANDLAEYIQSNAQTLESLQNQVDGQIEAWYKTVDPTTSNAPASSWNTTDLKDRHLGDIYYNVSNGHSWRWLKDGTIYSWQQIPDNDAAAALAAAQDAQSTANSKRRIFTTTPTVPYDLGDLWVNGSVVKYCTTAKTQSQSYNANDWTLTATDDTAASAVQSNLDSEVKQRKAIYATCTTAAATQNKDATCSDFALYNGATVTVKFNNANTHATPNLNVNSTGSKSIKNYRGLALTEAEYKWASGSAITFIYDSSGTYWRMQDGGALQAKADASASATAASGSASAASQSATAASGSANAASQSATSASGYASNASASATAASGSASAASQSATSASGYASNASGSASAASQSATAASGYASNASASATAASGYADDASASATAAAEVMGGFTILWNYSSYTNQSGGEAQVVAFDPKTSVISDANGWVKFNNVKRTINKVGINPNAVLPYKIPIYIVYRLSSASATTGTMYMVWYSDTESKWKYAITPTPTAIGGDWTWTLATDIILGKFVEPSGEAFFTDCEIFNPPLTSKHVTTNVITAVSAQDLATTANNTANAAAPKSSAVSRTQRIWYRTNASANLTGPTTWVTENTDVYSAWTAKCPPLAGSVDASGSNKYPYLYTCMQTQTVAQQAAGNVCTASAVLLDDSTTVIDGGKIITGTVTANKLDASDINASHLLTVGSMTTTTQNDILNENVIISGRNLTLGGNIKRRYKVVGSNNYFTPINLGTAKLFNTSNFGRSLLADTNNQYFTVSFDYIITGVDTAFNMWISLERADANYGSDYTYYSGWKSIPVGDSTGHFSVTIEPSNNHRTWGRAWLFGLPSSGNRSAMLTVWNFKFELGTRDTGFSLAPENVESLSNPNILPFFSIDPNDSNYWYTFERKNTASSNTEGYEACYIEPDGWAHFIEDTRAESGNSGKTGYQNLQLKPNALIPFIKPSTVYTLMIEARDVTVTSSVGYCFCTTSTSHATLNAFTGDSGIGIFEDGTYYYQITSKTAEELDGLTMANRGYLYLSAEQQAECRLRISLYEGYYSGPYKPYIGKLLYPSNTDLATTNLTLSGAVVDTQTIYIQAVSGTNTMAKKTDAWVSIATESTVSDTTGLTPVWTTKRPTYRSKYPVIFVAQQTKLIDGTIVCSTPAKDDTLTIIDGGHITTGTIDASTVNVTNLDASEIKTGKVQASQINSTNLHVSAANVDGKITASQINASGLSIGYSQLTNVPSIPSKVTDLSDGSSYAKSSEVAAAIDDISVGGRNLLFNTSDKWMGPYLPNVNANNYTIYPYYTDDTSWVVSGRYLTLTFEIEVNMVDGTGGTPTIYPQICLTKADNTTSWATRTNTTFATVLTDFTNQIGSGAFIAGNNTYRYSYTGVINITATDAKSVRLGIRADYVGSNTYIKFRNVKLELGNKATAWSPAPEDLSRPPAKNLHPFYTRGLRDIYDSIYNPKAMLIGVLPTSLYTVLEDGWVHCHMDNTSGTEQYSNASIRPKALSNGPSDKHLFSLKGYTILVEIRNNNTTLPSSGVADMYTQQIANTQFWGNGTNYGCTMEGMANNTGTIDFKVIGESYKYYMHRTQNVGTTTSYFTDTNNPVYTELFRYNLQIGPGGILDFDFRFSIYEGYYEGEYIPYVEDSLYLTDTQTRLAKTEASNLIMLDNPPLVYTMNSNSVTRVNWWVIQNSSAAISIEKTTNGVKITRATSSSGFAVVSLKPSNKLIAGDIVTLSFDYKTNNTRFGQLLMITSNNAQNQVQVSSTDSKPLEVNTSNWGHYEYTWTIINNSIYSEFVQLAFYGYSSAANDWLEIKDGTLKLERGNTLTRINEAEKRSNVDISVVSINYGSNTATLKATLYVDGVAKTSNVAYQWYKDNQIITGQTSQQLAVTSTMGLNHVYSCNVGY